MKKRSNVFLMIVALVAVALIGTAWAWHNEPRDMLFTGKVMIKDQLQLSDGVPTSFQTPQATSTGLKTEWVSGETLLSITTLSLAADGNTTIFTVPTGHRAVLTKAVLVAAADAGTSTLTIGKAGGPGDFLGTQTLSNIDAQYDVGILQPIPHGTTALSKSYAASTVIYAAVGSHAGSAGNTLYLFGFVY